MSSPHSMPSSSDVLTSDVSSTSRYVLASDLDLTQAKPLLEEMVARFRGGEIRIDAAEVDRVSTACVQVLMSGARSASKAAVAFSIEKPSEAFLKALCDLGVEAEFKNWMK